MPGQKITVVYGSSPREMTHKALEATEPFAELPPGSRIGLKPNLVKPKPSSSGATTSPEIIRAIIEHLNERGHYNIVILEGSWTGSRTEEAFRACGYEEISTAFDVPLINLQNDPAKKIKCHRKLSLNVSEKALALDCLVNVPVLKAHCQTKLTCALKNLKGCIPDKEKRRFHSLGLHEPIAYLNRILKNYLIIVDGIMGDLTHEGGGDPVEMGRILAGRDPVLIDSYAANLIGYRVEDIPYIKMAHDLGVGELFHGGIPLEELDKDKMPAVSIKAGDKAAYLAQWIEESEACSPCYGSLVHALRRLEESGELKKLKASIFVGRGFKNTPNDGWGIGSCTQYCTYNLPGCPPDSREIVEFLRSR